MLNGLIPHPTNKDSRYCPASAKSKTNSRPTKQKNCNELCVLNRVHASAHANLSCVYLHVLVEFKFRDESWSEKRFLLSP